MADGLAAEVWANLARKFDDVLFLSELRNRLQHHMAHVAPETWIAMELAYFINRNADELGMREWAAILERKKVDVTLVPPGVDPAVQELPEATQYLELKLVDSADWNRWKEVYQDLEGKGDKPPATYSVCFLIHAREAPWRRDDTTARHSALFHSVPDQGPAQLTPLEDMPPLLATSILPVHRLTWDRPVVGRWPTRFEADVRTVWVKQSRDR